MFPREKHYILKLTSANIFLYMCEVHAVYGCIIRWVEYMTLIHLNILTAI